MSRLFTPRIGFWHNRGLGLIELLMALALALGLGAAVVRQYLNTLHLQDLQAHLLETQRNAAYARYLLTQAIHASFATRCDGTASIDDARIRAWIANDLFGPPSAISGSAVLRLQTGECDAQVAEIFFLSRRAGQVDNPVALFRRRQRADGTYANAEEIVEGVSDLQFQLIEEVLFDDSHQPYYMVVDQHATGELVMVHVSMTFDMSDSLASMWPGGSANVFDFSVASRNRPGR